MEYRVRKEITVEEVECVFGDDMTPNYVPTKFGEQYAVQVKGFLRWHTVKAFRKIRAAVKFMRSLKERLQDEV